MSSSSSSEAPFVVGAKKKNIALKTKKRIKPMRRLKKKGRRKPMRRPMRRGKGLNGAKKKATPKKRRKMKVSLIGSSSSDSDSSESSDGLPPKTGLMKKKIRQPMNTGNIARLRQQRKSIVELLATKRKTSKAIKEKRRLLGNDGSDLSSSSSDVPNKNNKMGSNRFRKKKKSLKNLMNKSKQSKTIKKKPMFGSTQSKKKRNSLGAKSNDSDSSDSLNENAMRAKDATINKKSLVSDSDLSSDHPGSLKGTLFSSKKDGKSSPSSEESRKEKQESIDSDSSSDPAKKTTQSKKKRNSLGAKSMKGKKKKVSAGTARKQQKKENIIFTISPSESGSISSGSTIDVNELKKSNQMNAAQRKLMAKISEACRETEQSEMDSDSSDSLSGSGSAMDAKDATIKKKQQSSESDLSSDHPDNLKGTLLFSSKKEGKSSLSSEESKKEKQESIDSDSSSDPAKKTKQPNEIKSLLPPKKEDESSPSSSKALSDSKLPLQDEEVNEDIRCLFTPPASADEIIDKKRSSHSSTPRLSAPITVLEFERLFARPSKPRKISTKKRKKKKIKVEEDGTEWWNTLSVPRRKISVEEKEYRETMSKYKPKPFVYGMFGTHKPTPFERERSKSVQHHVDQLGDFMSEECRWNRTVRMKRFIHAPVIKTSNTFKYVWYPHKYSS